MRDRARRLALRLRADLGPEDYDLFGFSSRPMADAVHYLSRDTCRTLLIPTLNDATAVEALEDKVRCGELLRSAGVPTPELLAVRDSEAGDAALKASLGEHAAAGVVVKPVQGQKGRGVVVFTRLRPDGSGGPTNRGRQMSLGRALRRASRRSRDGRVLVEQRLRQHAAMDRYAPQRTSGVRVYTLRRSDGSTRLLGAYLRLGRAGAMTDNVARGGVAVDVDERTGQLGRGLLIVGDRATWSNRHPDRGARFRGQVLPLWDDVLDVCHRAAAAVEGVALVGWDVLVTDNGPFVLEGNWDVRLYIVQTMRGGLLDDTLRNELAELGVDLPRVLPGLVPSLMRRRPRRTPPAQSSSPPQTIE